MSPVKFLQQGKFASHAATNVPAIAAVLVASETWPRMNTARSSAASIPDRSDVRRRTPAVSKDVAPGQNWYICGRAGGGASKNSTLYEPAGRRIEESPVAFGCAGPSSAKPEA